MTKTSTSSNPAESKYFNQSSSSSKSYGRSSELTLDKLPKANETFSLEMYNKAGFPMMMDRKRDLFSGLDQTVKSINFNNFSSENLSEVTIHKRNRTSDEGLSHTSSDSQSTTLSDYEVPKKKKYKIIPNSFVSPPSKIESFSSSKVMNQSSENSVNAGNVVEKTLPTDRKELLLFVSTFYSKNNWQIIILAISLSTDQRYAEPREVPSIFERFSLL